MKKHTKEVKEEAHLNYYGLWSPWLLLLWFTSLTCTLCLKFPSKSCESVSMWMPKWIRISITSTFCWSYYGYWIRVVIMWRLEPLTFFCCVCRDQVLLVLELVKCWRWQWNYDNRCGWPFLFWIWWRPVGDDLERCSGMILEALWLLLVSQEWCVWNECWVVEMVNVWRIRRGASPTMDTPVEG
jgi:hypothetical protein